MSRFEVVMPKLGESIIEATITKWLKKPGDPIQEEDNIVEIATDKVDSEIPSPVDGTLLEILYKEGDIVPVGKVIAIIELSEGTSVSGPAAISQPDNGIPSGQEDQSVKTDTKTASAAYTRFYSPLVRNIAKEESIPLDELEAVKGSGKEGRLTKKDILDYVSIRSNLKVPSSQRPVETALGTEPTTIAVTGDQIIEMDRMRRLIADHMVQSKHVSPHVTSFIEVDVTNMVKWRAKIKDQFYKKEGEKLTFTPIFIEAAAKALKDFPDVNASVDGYNIIIRKNIHIGMATALPSGNLIVPVIKNADQKNLLGLAKSVNDLAGKARNNILNPDDIQGGTFTITNFGTFNSLTGTPIINQPQVAILGIGVVKKRPVVIETEDGDMIAIRHIMILSLSYDHRAVDGALGGMYLRKVADYLENFDTNRTI
ncbi:MAG: dihydrolipoamide acetyltransferase family protein [Bacteroidetes bacterium]|nr:dihydrolipoamide acetyltransferase family protein [Bacteroidota bacterium]